MKQTRSFSVLLPALFLLLLSTIVVAQEPPLFSPYEVAPKSSNGNLAYLTGNAKERGGSPFFCHEEGSPVEELRVWVEGENIRGIFMKLFSGTTFIIGSQGEGAADAVFNFEPGERIRGDIILTGNGSATRLGSIEFNTDKNKNFKVGNQKTNYFYPSGDSYLMGFHGFAGSEVDLLGIYMMKPIQSDSLIDVNYTLSELPSTPNKFETSTVLNSGSTPTTSTISYTQTRGKSQEWSTSRSSGLSFTGSVTAGIPLIDAAEFTAEFSWQTSTEEMYQSSTYEEESVQQTIDVTVPPCRKVTYEVSWLESKSPIPFSAKIAFTYTDGTEYTKDIQGEYRGVSSTKGFVNIETEEPIEGCGAPTAGPTNDVPPLPIPTEAPVASSSTTAPGISSTPVAMPIVAPVPFPVAIPTTAPSPVPIATNPPGIDPTVNPVPSFPPAPVLTNDPLSLPTSSPVIAPFPLPPPQPTIPSISVPLVPGGNATPSGAAQTNPDGLNFEGNVIQAEGDIDITLIQATGDDINLITNYADEGTIEMNNPSGPSIIGQFPTYTPTVNPPTAVAPVPMTPTVPSSGSAPVATHHTTLPVETIGAVSDGMLFDENNNSFNVDIDINLRNAETSVEYGMSYP